MSVHFTGTVGGHPGGGSAFNDYCGSSSGSYNFDQGTGIFVKSINTYSKNDDQGLHAIQFSFWNGYESPLRGSRIGNSNRISLERGEKIKKCTLWGNGKGTRCGRLKLETDKGQVFDVGKDTRGQDAFEQEVWGGFLCGGYGRAGSDVDHLGLAFFGVVTSMKIKNLKYTKPIEQFGNLKNLSLQSLDWNNTTGKEPIQWDFTNSQTKEHSWECSSSVSLTFGGSITVEAGIPEVVKVGATAKFETQMTYSSTTSFKESQMLSWSTKGSLPAGQKIHVEALTTEGNISDLPYTCDVEAKVDGNAWKYTEEGTLRGVSYTNVWTEVT